MYCKNCGKQLNEAGEFCAGCGTKADQDRSDQAAEVVKQQDPKLKGLGGWLVLVCIGLLAAVVMQGVGAYQSLQLFTNGTVEFLSDPDSESHIPGYGGALKFELIGEIAFFVLGIYLIYLFFNKNRRFPKLYIGFLITSVVYLVLDFVIISSLSVPTAELQNVLNDSLSQLGTSIGGAVMGALIWGSYIKNSKRVRATFYGITPQPGNPPTKARGKVLMAAGDIPRKKRPGWVWAFSIFFFLSPRWTFFSFYLINTGIVPVNPAQKAYLDSLTGVDYGITILMVIANMAGAVALLFLRKIAFYLFITALSANLLLTAWHTVTKGWVEAIGVAGFLGAFIGLALLIAVCVYSGELIQRGVLT